MTEKNKKMVLKDGVFTPVLPKDEPKAQKAPEDPEHPPLKIKNFYAGGHGKLPMEKARLSEKSILIRPITYKDFPTQGSLQTLAKSQRDSTEAWIFLVISTGAAVSICKPGEFIIPTAAAIDVVVPDVNHVLVQEEDIRMVFTEEDLM